VIYDAIIVGAGPGGSSAAYVLGSAGWKVLVVEKENVPRYKTCGGGLSFHMLRKYFPFSFDAVIESRCQSISYALGKNMVTHPLPDNQMGMVMRDRFDAYILSQAPVEVCQGVHIHKVSEQADRVVVEDKNGATYEARYLIGADGASSVVARSLGLRRKKPLVAAIEVEAAASPEVMSRFSGGAVFIFGEIRLGYLWIFPKSDHLSVGVGAYHPRPGELQAALKRVMTRFGVSLDGCKIHGHPIPVYTRREKIASARTLLVGDAAGLVDPLSGEGIRMAIKSGHMAARALLEGHPERYPGRVLHEIGASQSLGMVLIPVFYYLTELAFLFGVHNPFANQAFMDLLSDKISYRGVMLRLFATLPLFILTELTAALAGLFGGPARRQKIRSAVYSL